MRKSRKSDYIILALLCLIILNIGAIGIGLYSSKLHNVSKKEFKITNIPFEKVKNMLNINMEIRKTINSFFPMTKKLDNKRNSMEERISLPENEEYNSENDIIIENLHEYESLIIVKDSNELNTIDSIPEPLTAKKFKIDKEKPYILIYHTHATEAYLMAKSNNYRSQDKKNNMISIGNTIATVLEANGHKVDHVETVHDLPSYNKSYSRSLNTIKNKMAESSNIKVLLDIHRDAIVDESPNMETVKAKSKTDIGGKSVATFSLVVGPDSVNKEQVLGFAKYVKAVSDTLYPGLCRGILIKPRGKYNQYLSDYSALIEVGYNFNTIEEANEGAKLVGEVLSMVMSGLLEE
ncbi:stage II sporulation protein P [Tissierella praeacuta]|uniref:stage II sporulation protein P n=1 Tax=Tissierella praeacuta TaxID=43131 RepID=UPI00104BBCBB|nr:stage II sporulation protein P [Tissierella praeacuta]TCU71705.1 stage II sporulation protein P [Tissierella praeacuta]